MKLVHSFIVPKIDVSFLSVNDVNQIKAVVRLRLKAAVFIPVRNGHKPVSPPASESPLWVLICDVNHIKETRTQTLSLSSEAFMVLHLVVHMKKFTSLNTWPNAT